jgi:telomerase Cajal body protein 1
MLLKCVASADQRGRDTSVPSSEHHVTSYRSLQWSADGTCLIGTSYQHAIETFVVPVDLLDDHSEPMRLESYSSIASPDPINAVVGYPFFDLQDPNTNLILAAQRDHPIRLSSSVTGERVASYPLVNALTEAYICPNALLFSCDGSKFISGSENLLSVFDVSSPGSEPILSTQTGPKKVQDDRWNPSTSVRGIVSALAIEPSSRVMATGTFTRHIGLYDLEGQGACVGAFSIAGNDADAKIGGGGITQVSWSPCGRYLYIAERKSDGVMLYDIRNTGQLLSWCQGRKAMTNQRLAIDLAMAGENSYEIWAGGSDGVARSWTDAHLHEGAVLPGFEQATSGGMATHVPQLLS